MKLYTTMLAALVLLTPSLADAATRLVSVYGEVEVLNAGRQEQARLGMLVEQGSEVITGADGRAEILIDNESLMQIGPNTRIAAETLQPRKKSIIKVAFGWVRSFVSRHSDASSFQVRTATAVAGVRGTIFSVEVDEEGGTSIRCLSGRVSVQANGGSGPAFEIAARQMANVLKSGKASQREMSSSEVEQESKGSKWEKSQSRSAGQQIASATDGTRTRGPKPRELRSDQGRPLPLRPPLGSPLIDRISKKKRLSDGNTRAVVVPKPKF